MAGITIFERKIFHADENLSGRHLRRFFLFCRRRRMTQVPAATIIRPASIFGITPKQCPMMIAVLSASSATPLSTPDRHRSNPLIFPKRLSAPLCRTMTGIRCIGISAACSDPAWLLLGPGSEPGELPPQAAFNRCCSNGIRRRCDVPVQCVGCVRAR